MPRSRESDIPGWLRKQLDEQNAAEDARIWRRPPAALVRKVKTLMLSPTYKMLWSPQCWGAGDGKGKDCAACKGWDFETGVCCPCACHSAVNDAAAGVKTGRDGDIFE